MTFAVEIELVGPPHSSSDEPRRCVATFEADDEPSDVDLRIAIAQARVMHEFVARVDGEPSAAVVEEINVKVSER